MARKSEFFGHDPERSGPEREREASRGPAAGWPSVENAALAAEVVRLTNRTALFTLAAAGAMIAALVAVPRAVSTETTAVRIAAVVALAAAVLAVFGVWRSRVRLRAARRRAGVHPT